MRVNCWRCWWSGRQLFSQLVSRYCYSGVTCQTPQGMTVSGWLSEPRFLKVDLKVLLGRKNVSNTTTTAITSSPSEMCPWITPSSVKTHRCSFPQLFQLALYYRLQQCCFCASQLGRDALFRQWSLGLPIHSDRLSHHAMHPQYYAAGE